MDVVLLSVTLRTSLFTNQRLCIIRKVGNLNKSCTWPQFVLLTLPIWRIATYYVLRAVPPISPYTSRVIFLVYKVRRLSGPNKRGLLRDRFLSGHGLKPQLFPYRSCPTYAHRQRIVFQLRKTTSSNKGTMKILCTQYRLLPDAKSLYHIWFSAMGWEFQ